MKRKLLSIITCMTMIMTYFMPLAMATNTEVTNTSETDETKQEVIENTDVNSEDIQQEEDTRTDNNQDIEQDEESIEEDIQTEETSSDSNEDENENTVNNTIKEPQLKSKGIESVESKAQEAISMNLEETEAESTDKRLEYSTHMENFGWLETVNSGASGAEGKRLRIEAFKVKVHLDDEEYVTVSYSAHVQDIGWQGWVSNGQVAGTTGQGKRTEAIKIRLNYSSKYSIQYRVCVETQGWTNWVKDGEIAGTVGKALKIEAIEIRIIPNENYDSSEEENLSGLINYKAHVQNVGDMEYVKDGEIAGTSNRGLRMEGLAIKLGSEISKNISLSIDEHIENIGWKRGLTENNYIGTKGQGLRIEALSIKLKGDKAENYTIQYRAHVQNIGWQAWKSDGEIAGTTGVALRIEAIQIKIAEKKPVAKMYIDTPEDGVTNSPKEAIISGWKMSNIENSKLQVYLDGSKEPLDEKCITYKKRNDVIEKITEYGNATQNPLPGFDISIPTKDLSKGKHIIRIAVVANNEVLVQENRAFIVERKLSIEYSAHVQNTGWLSYVDNGETAGFTGPGLRLEAFKINLYNVEDEGTIKYTANVQNIGWQDYVQNNEIAGTVGPGNRIEAIKIELTGKLAEKYDIYYRTHIQTYGWLAWTKNGAAAGTEDIDFRVEAIQVQIVEKGTNIDTSGCAYVIKPTIKYRARVQNIGWQDYVNEGETIGTTNRGLSVEAIQLKMENAVVSGTIQTSTHVENIGWMNFVNVGTVSGTEGRGLKVEALKIRLTDDLAKYFDIYYRAHVQNMGWLAWAKNGESAGTAGYSYRMEALEIKVVPKESDAPGKRSGHFYNKALEKKSIEGIKLILGNICAGIDVSKHNGSINWDSVRSDTDFAIIRCGFGRNIEKYDDEKFEENMNACIAHGIPVDVYIYSYADSISYASSEADHVIRLCEKYKNYIGKVWYDVEDDSVFSLIHDGSLPVEGLGQIIDTFAWKVRSAGYDVGVYTYISALNSYFPSRIKNEYPIWIAHFAGEAQDIFESLYNTYRKLFNLWQFTSEGSINGVSGNVDLSIRF